MLPLSWPFWWYGTLFLHGCRYVVYILRRVFSSHKALFSHCCCTTHLNVSPYHATPITCYVSRIVLCRNRMVPVSFPSLSELLLWQLTITRMSLIIWTKAEISSIGPLGTNFGEMLFNIQTFLFKECMWKWRLEIVTTLSRPQCVNALRPRRKGNFADDIFKRIFLLQRAPSHDLLDEVNDALCVWSWWYKQSLYVCHSKLNETIMLINSNATSQSY